MDEKSQNSFRYDPEQENQDELMNPEQQADVDQKKSPESQPVSWMGSEFIANQKDGKWFAGFFGALVLVVAIVFILTRDYVSAISIALVGTLFAFLANHKPRQLAYTIDNSGINIGSRFYPFEQFKSFSLAREDAIDYVNLMPLKRFMPDVSIYFPPNEMEKIVTILSDHLPHHDTGERQIDKLAKKLRF